MDGTIPNVVQQIASHESLLFLCKIGLVEHVMILWFEGRKKVSMCLKITTSTSCVILK
jgi:hypothetical protein